MRARPRSAPYARPMARVKGLDHVVLRCRDVQRMLDWYCGTLGLEPMGVEDWRSGTASFPSARIDATTIIDFMPRPDGEPAGPPNVDHLCLVVEDATDIEGLDIVKGPVPRGGAQGMATSFYLYDPDDNLVELRYY